MSRIKARKTLERRIKRGGEWRGPLPDTLLLSQIETIPALMQYRDPSAHKSEAHKQKLYRAIKRKGEPLTRVKVMWAGDGWACIEGHHRLEAYGRAVESGHWEAERPIPVEHFTGTLKEAALEANAENSRDKLPMEDGEKENAAWQLFATEDVTKREVMEALGISYGTAGNMRKALQVLKDEHPKLDPSTLKWWQARHLAKGQTDGPSMDAEERQRKWAREIAKSLAQKYGDRFSRAPTLLIAVLRELDGDLPATLHRLIGVQMEDEEAAEGQPSEAEGLPFL